MLSPSCLPGHLRLSKSPCPEPWQVPGVPDGTGTDQLYLGCGGGRVLPTQPQDSEEPKRVILSSCVHCSSHCSLRATSSYCPCRVPPLPEGFQNVFFFSGCTIYPFVFSATADPLRARSISAVKIIPVKTVKNSAGLVLPPGISPWVGFFLFFFSLLADHA